MHRSIWPLLLVLAATGVRADEPVAVKLKPVGPGESFWADRQSDVEMSLQLTAEGATQKQSQKSTHRATYRETVLEKKPKEKRPTRLEREYERAEVTIQGRSQRLPYQGQTVVIEKQDDGYQFRVKGGEDLSAKDAPFLDQEFNSGEGSTVDEELFLPKKPVAVGESWPIDPKLLIAAFEKNSPLRVDAAKATGTGKLVKIYRRNDRQYGVLSLRVELPLTTYTQGLLKVPLKDTSRAVIDATADLCIDGTSMDGKMDITTDVTATNAQVSVDGKEYALTLSIRNRGKELRADPPKR